jgi:hypothetical protein
MVPYLPRVLENLQMYLTQEETGEATSLQTQALGKYIAV